VVSYNFLASLCARTLVPLIVVALAIFLGSRALKRGNKTAGYMLFNGGVLLTFLVYPNVTQTVFKFFQVMVFDGEYGKYMMADYSIDASGESYSIMTPYAVAMVAVWPFGVPFIISILLWRGRSALLEVRRREKILSRGSYDSAAWSAHVKKQTRLGIPGNPRDEEPIEVEGYLWALTESYRGTVFYFEVVEYALQKLTLVGLLVFYQPGTLEQLTLGLLICFFYFGLCCYLLPFGTRTDNMMAIVTQFSLFITLLSAIIIEHGPADTPRAVTNILLVSSLVPIVTALCLSVQGALNEMGFNPLAVAATPVERAVTRRLSASTRAHHRVQIADSSNECTTIASSLRDAAPIDASPQEQLKSAEPLTATADAADTSPAVTKTLFDDLLTATADAADTSPTVTNPLDDLSDRVKALFSGGRTGDLQAGGLETGVKQTSDTKAEGLEAGGQRAVDTKEGTFEPTRSGLTA